MKKIMMIGLVVCGGVQGIQGMGWLEKRLALANLTSNYLEIIHRNITAKNMRRNDLAAKVAAARQREQLSDIAHRNSQFINVDQPSPRSWIPKPETRRVKLRDTLTRQAISHPELAALYA